MNLLLLIVAALILAVIVSALAIRAMGGNIGLVEHWTAFYKHYSTYALLLVGMLPDIFNEIVTGGYLDGTTVSDEFTWLNRGAVLFTFLVLKIKQAPKPTKPVFTE